MKLIFETCRPRQDVLTGELREERFAAHLRDVITETADPVYKDARVFLSGLTLPRTLKSFFRRPWDGFQGFALPMTRSSVWRRALEGEDPQPHRSLPRGD